MKKVITLATLLVASVCMAEEKAAKANGPDRPKGPREHAMSPEMMKELVAKFDKDGDGKLNEAEVKAAREARQAEMLKKFDKDGDGKLSPEEMKTAGEARRAEMMKKFDKDGDGKVSEEEKKAAHEAFKKSHDGDKPRGDRPKGDKPREEKKDK